MADVFHHKDVRSLIHGKYVLFFGGSNIRALYKDLLVLLVSNRLILDKELTKKLEPSFLGDSLLHAIGLTRGRDFKEHRIFTMDDTIIEYFFVTRCLCPDVINTLEEIRSGERRTPDLIVMNSTLWDISRWGSQSVTLFKDNLQKLVDGLKRCLPPTTLVIWLTVPPVSQDHRGVLIPEVEFLKHTMRFDSMEANVFAHKIVTANGYDVLDLHYYMKLNVHRRWKDGVHWVSAAVRYMTNLLLTHISLAWGCDVLPGKEGRQEIQLERLQESIGELSEAVQNPVEPAKENLKGDNDETSHEGESDFTNEENRDGKEYDFQSNCSRLQKRKPVVRGSLAARCFSRKQSKKVNNNRNKYQQWGEREHRYNTGISDERFYDDNNDHPIPTRSIVGSEDHDSDKSESCDFSSDQYHSNDNGVEQYESRIKDRYNNGYHSDKHYRYTDNYYQRRPVKRLLTSYKCCLELRHTGSRSDHYLSSDKSHYRGYSKARQHRSDNSVRHRSSRHEHKLHNGRHSKLNMFVKVLANTSSEV